jgi:DNA (cytosine-5)-methyltransferase 1
VPFTNLTGLTFTDIFCGAGGSSIGLTKAGLTLALGANHWRTAIDTHAANFTAAEHLCADMNNYEMRRLPSTDVLWASPICTELSPAGGHRKRITGRRVDHSQMDLLRQLNEQGPVSSDALIRTRATFHDVIRATEVHRYRAVVVENVPDALAWELFDWWLDGMVRLGYRFQLISVSSAHIHGDTYDPAPQWRDRLYIVFTHVSVGRLPDLQPTPRSRCPRCRGDVDGVQTWCAAARRLTLRAGRYRRNPTSTYGQYWYTCPTCGPTVRVEPYILPAAVAIDWTDLGTPIPELPKPPVPNTRRRIETGLQMFGGDGAELPIPPFMLNAAHDDARVGLTTNQPMPTRTVKIGDGLCVPPPMLVPVGGTWADDATDAIGEPARTRTANPKGFEALVTPGAFIAMLRRNSTATSPYEPLATLTTTGRHHALIVPYYSNGQTRPVTTPLDTVPTNDRFGLLTGTKPRTVTVDDCRYRMFKPRESLRSQCFPDNYIVRGNEGEQTMQAGNAVSANVAQWIGGALIRCLDAR